MEEEICKCEEIKRIWNKEEKTEEERKYLSIAVLEQFEKFNDYWDEDEEVGHLILKCKDCGKLIDVPSW
jgi:hypothetical protein